MERSRGFAGHVFVVEVGERVPQGFNVYAQELRDRKLAKYNEHLTAVLATHKLELYSESCAIVGEDDKDENNFVLGHVLHVKVCDD